MASIAAIKGQEFGTFRWAALAILHQPSMDGEGFCSVSVGRWIAICPPDRAPIRHARRLAGERSHRPEA